MNFSFSIDKEGKMRALPHPVGDALALLDALDLLGKRWKSITRFFREESLNKVDFLCKIYYPIYLVREGNYVVPIDGMGFHKKEVVEFSEQTDEYGVYSSKKYHFPIVGNEKLLKWIEATSEEEVQDGYAVPYILTREEAKFVAKEVVRIYRTTEASLDKLFSEVENCQARYKENVEKIYEKYKSLNEEYEKKIAEKNAQIEELLIESEKDAINKIKEESQKRKESLRSERKNLENLMQNMRNEVKIIDDKVNKIKKNMDELKSQKMRVEERLEKLKVYGKRVEEDKEKFDDIRQILKSIKECERLLEDYINKGSLSSGELSELEERKGRMLKRIEELQRAISRLAEEEKLLSSREDMELRKARQDFVKKREMMIKELNVLLAEHDRAVWELRIKENRLKFDMERCKDNTNNLIRLLEEHLNKLKSFVWKGLKLSSDVELLYIPYYITSKNEKPSIIEPPIVLEGYKNVEGSREVGLNKEVIEVVVGSWEVLSVILFEAKEVFDILSGRNKNRVLQGIEILKELGVINRMQEAILLKRCVS